MFSQHFLDECLGGKHPSLTLRSKLTVRWLEKPPWIDGMKPRKDGDFHGRAVSFREGISDIESFSETIMDDV